MDYVYAKILKTGEKTILSKMTCDGCDVYADTYGTKYTTEDVEELEPCDDTQHQPQPQQPDDPLAQLPQEMVQMITDMVNGYIDRFDAMYWQRQRVEIVKVLMNRLDVATFDPIAICELADKYIQMLKNYE